jgi:hypothetical protein
MRSHRGRSETALAALCSIARRPLYVVIGHSILHRRFCERRWEETTMVNTANWDKFSKRIILGLLMAAVVAACFLLLGIYIVGAGI